MKRILSWVLTFVMVLGLFGSFSVQFAFAADLNEYDALVTPGSAVYGDTYVVNSNWTDAMQVQHFLTCSAVRLILKRIMHHVTLILSAPLRTSGLRAIQQTARLRLR